MTLVEYLQAHSLNASQFAVKMRVPASTITRVLNGERDPSLGLLRRISDATGGEVTPNDFLSSCSTDQTPEKRDGAMPLQQGEDKSGEAA